jgi:hypothetical protein
MEQTVGEQGRRPDASPALRGATKIVASRGIQLARLAKRIAVIARSSTLARGITIVDPTRRAPQVDAELRARVVIEHELALVLRLFRPGANASLGLAGWRLTLSRGAMPPQSCTSVVFTTRLIDLGHLAEVVVEGVLRERRSRRQGLGESGGRYQKKTTCSRHPFITSFRRGLAGTGSPGTPTLATEGETSGIRS